MMKNYIKNHWTNSRFYASFSIDGYAKRLKGFIMSHPDFKKEIEPILEEKSLSREKVFNCVRQDSYKGFLAAMLWGGISLATSKRKPISNAERAFSIERERVVAILSKVTMLLKENKISEAYDYLESGDGKIDGIGISYLTKILYFFSTDRSKEALIFDKWSKFMHAALIICDPKGDIDSFYKYSHKEDFKSELIFVKSPKEMYLDYLSRMQEMVKTLSELDIPSAGHLEAFLFGDKLYKRNKNENNPRFFIYKFVEGFFLGKTLIHRQNDAQSYDARLLKVYDGKRIDNQGKTFQILNEPKGFSHQAKNVFIEYHGYKYEAKIGTYTQCTTLRGPDIRRLIKENDWKPGDSFKCSFVRNNEGTDIYGIIEQL